MVAKLRSSNVDTAATKEKDSQLSYSDVGEIKEINKAAREVLI